MSRSFAVSRSASAWKLSASSGQLVTVPPGPRPSLFLQALDARCLRQLLERLDHLTVETAGREQRQHPAEARMNGVCRRWR